MSRFTQTLFAAAALCTAVVASAGDLTIAIDDVKPVGGNLMIALYNSADTFMKKPLTGMLTPARQADNSITFKDLPAGDYAFVLYHDANENGQLDKNALGIPTEDYAFSNNALGKMGPPSFELARFSLPEAGLVTRVSLR